MEPTPKSKLSLDNYVKRAMVRGETMNAARLRYDLSILELRSTHHSFRIFHAFFLELVDLYCNEPDTCTSIEVAGLIFALYLSDPFQERGYRGAHVFQTWILEILEDVRYYVSKGNKEYIKFMKNRILLLQAVQKICMMGDKYPC